MLILWNNKQALEIRWHDTPVAQAVAKAFKHLQHVPLPWRPWDDSRWVSRVELSEVVDIFVGLAQELKIDVDPSLCLIRDQQYLNHLHTLYESVDKNNKQFTQSNWMEFHELIHRIERYPRDPSQTINIDYRHYYGLLEQPMKKEWMTPGVIAQYGDVMVNWTELGKTPFDYMRDGEPNDIRRICQLAKPWITLKPKLNIAYGPQFYPSEQQTAEYKQWWAPYEPTWLKRWGLAEWTLAHQFTSVPVGRLLDMDTMVSWLDQGYHPIGVKL
jgi:hypothetical protein